MNNITLKIENNGMNGEGIARLNGKVVFVEGAVKGDVVDICVIKENKNFIYACVNSLKEQSVHRCTPKCKYYGECGGCNMQHINYQKALEIKTQNVQNLLNKQKLNTIVLPCIKSENVYGYRNKLTMYFTKNNSLGFYEKNSKKLIDINSCELVGKNFNNLINKLNIFFKNNKEFSPLVLKGLAIREINNIFLINFILTKKVNFLKLENYLKLNKINYSIYYCINTSNNNLPTYPCFFVGGQQRVIIEENNIKYPVYPLSFLQVNNDVKKLIYDNILNLVQSGGMVLDAYSGAGLLSCMLARVSKRVFAVEIDESAHSACKELCKLNKVNNLVAVHGSCENEVPKIIENNKIDTAILDPARKGVDKITLYAILNAKPSKIIYLSCNPATLARDLGILCLGGEYKILSVQPYDMFPQTSEVETLVCLEKV